MGVAPNLFLVGFPIYIYIYHVNEVSMAMGVPQKRWMVFSGKIPEMDDE